MFVTKPDISRNVAIKITAVTYVNKFIQFLVKQPLKNNEKICSIFTLTQYNNNKNNKNRDN